MECINKLPASSCPLIAEMWFPFRLRFGKYPIYCVWTVRKPGSLVLYVNEELSHPLKCRKRFHSIYFNVLKSWQCGGFDTCVILVRNFSNSDPHIIFVGIRLRYCIIRAIIDCPIQRFSDLSMSTSSISYFDIVNVYKTNNCVNCPMYSFHFDNIRLVVSSWFVCCQERV